jgi:hypothetical protein
MLKRGLAEPSRTAAKAGRIGQGSPLWQRTLVLVTLALLALWATASALATGARPVLGHHGETLKWNEVGKRRVYRLMINVAGRKRVITVMRRRSIRPHPFPGATAVYRVKAAYNESRWSNPVIIHYPAASGPSAASQASLLAGANLPSTAAALEAASSEAPIPEPLPGNMFVGVSAGGWGPTAFKDVAGAAKYVRMDARFANDSEVGGAATAGVSVASWVFGTGGSIGAINPVSYAAEVVTLFKRYGRGGTFWRGRKRDLGSRAVEVLNEPGNPGFWGDPTNYAAYVTLLRTVHEALAANFPEAIRPEVLASWDGGEGPSSAFGPGWSALGGLAYCDGVTVHPYGGADGGDGGALGGHEDVERARRVTGKPVYVTEVGWPTAVGQRGTGDSQQWTEAQQAENITNFVRWARATEYVAMVLVFNYVDYGTNMWYGIERSDRTHKPSFAALANA